MSRTAKTLPCNKTGLNQVSQSTDTLLCNDDGLKAIREEKNRYSLFFMLTGSGTLALSLVGAVLGVFTLVGFSYAAANTTAKCARLEATLEKLLVEEFRALDIHAYPLPLVKGATEDRSADIYVRFPGKTQILIATRSMGTNAVVYHEARENLRIKRRRKGNCDVEPCPLMGLNESKRWIEKNRHIFNLSSRQVTKIPTAKLLVICGNTRISSHRDNLYTEIGRNKYLTCFKQGNKTFVVNQENVANFVRDWLTHLDAQKK